VSVCALEDIYDPTEYNLKFSKVPWEPESLENAIGARALWIFPKPKKSLPPHNWYGPVLSRP
jgi:hypothetical protein